LKHTLFVIDNNLWRSKINKSLQAVEGC